eukprot:scaffold30948_cov112-Isochrysis_galbana.AAC.5
MRHHPPATASPVAPPRWHARYRLPVHLPCRQRRGHPASRLCPTGRRVCPGQAQLPTPVGLSPPAGRAWRPAV